MQHVKDIMTKNPKTCTFDHPLTCSLEIMRDESCGAVPVVNQEQKVMGIITDRDIAFCLLNKEKTPNQLTVGDCVKSKQVITVKPDDDVHHAVELMEEHQVRRLPVVDEQMRCVGIVAQADIALKDENKKEVAEFVHQVSKKERHTVGANP